MRPTSTRRRGARRVRWPLPRAVCSCRIRATRGGPGDSGVRWRCLSSVTGCSRPVEAMDSAGAHHRARPEARSRDAARYAQSQIRPSNELSGAQMAAEAGIKGPRRPCTQTLASPTVWCDFSSPPSSPRTLQQYSRRALRNVTCERPARRHHLGGCGAARPCRARAAPGAARRETACTSSVRRPGSSQGAARGARGATKEWHEWCLLLGAGRAAAPCTLAAS